MSKKYLILSILLTVLFLTACPNAGGPSDGSVLPSVTVRGVIPAGFRTLGQAEVSAALAVPLNGMEFGTENLDNAVLIDILPDGTFSTTLDTGSDWMILLLDEEEILPQDRIVGYVAVSAGTETIVKLPVSEAVADLDLGTLVADGEDFVSAEAVGESIFNLTAEEIAILGRTDNLYKGVKNLYLNYDAATGAYYDLTMKLTINFDSDVTKDNFIDIAGGDYQFYGYAFIMDTNTLTVSDLPDFVSHTQDLAFYPPGTVVGGRGDILEADRTWDENNPMTTELAYEDNGALRDDHHFCSGFETGGAILEWASEGNDLTGIIPEGPWYLCTYSGTPPADPTADFDAVFDGQVMWPLDADNNPRVFLPSLRLVTDGATGRVTQVDLRWYWYDAAASVFKIVGNTDLVEQTLEPGSFRIQLRDKNDTDESLTGLADSYTPVQYGWYFTEAPDHRVDSIFITYVMNGVQYTFEGQSSTQQ